MSPLPPLHMVRRTVLGNWGEACGVDTQGGLLTGKCNSEKKDVDQNTGKFQADKKLGGKNWWKQESLTL